MDLTKLNNRELYDEIEAYEDYCDGDHYSCACGCVFCEDGECYACEECEGEYYPEDCDCDCDCEDDNEYKALIAEMERRGYYTLKHFGTNSAAFFFGKYSTIEEYQNYIAIHK